MRADTAANVARGVKAIAKDIGGTFINFDFLKEILHSPFQAL